LHRRLSEEGRSEALRRLIMWLLAPDPEDRPSAEQAMDHEFFAQLDRQQLENEDMVAPEIKEALNRENETVVEEEGFL
jgi:serine/threonine protein kinase